MLLKDSQVLAAFPNLRICSRLLILMSLLLGVICKEFHMTNYWPPRIQTTLNYLQANKDRPLGHGRQKVVTCCTTMLNGINNWGWGIIYVSILKSIFCLISSLACVLSLLDVCYLLYSCSKPWSDRPQFYTRPYWHRVDSFLRGNY